ncbi:MAG: squalene/phytoene synthase family protein [Pelagimonas sp.]|jgi:phytoene/squalene synthetase|nr:squalene/phytoene synthase family protein [Pelagimonas sp.]
MDWSEGSDLVACAKLVEGADPERFASVMASPVMCRTVLFPIYAFNAEIARIPWITKEEMIAEMRFQWWKDALDEIAAGGLIRRHEVVTPLALVATPGVIACLKTVVEARRQDLDKSPFKDAAALRAYLYDSGGALMQAAVLALGDTGDVAQDVARDLGYAAGLASYLLAVPELVARGKLPLPDGRSQAIRDLALDGLETLARARGQRAQVSKGGAALASAWMAAPVLKAAAAQPERVGDAALLPSEAVQRMRRLWVGTTGRW